MLKLRFARGGRKGKPIYSLVVAESSSPRDGRFVEKLGSYNPLLKVNKLSYKKDRVEYWVSKGAQMTERLARLVKKASLEGSESLEISSDASVVAEPSVAVESDADVSSEPV